MGGGRGVDLGGWRGEVQGLEVVEEGRRRREEEERRKRRELKERMMAPVGTVGGIRSVGKMQARGEHWQGKSSPPADRLQVYNGIMKRTSVDSQREGLPGPQRVESLGEDFSFLDSTSDGELQDISDVENMVERIKILKRNLSVGILKDIVADGLDHDLAKRWKGKEKKLVEVENEVSLEAAERLSDDGVLVEAVEAGGKA